MEASAAPKTDALSSVRCAEWPVDGFSISTGPPSYQPKRSLQPSSGSAMKPSSDIDMFAMTRAM